MTIGIDPSIPSFPYRVSIESTSSKNGYVKVINQSEQDNSCQFQLEIIPPSLTARGLYFRDVFSVNIENGPKLDIAIVGYYAKDAGKPKKPVSDANIRGI